MDVTLSMTATDIVTWNQAWEAFPWFLALLHHEMIPLKWYIYIYPHHCWLVYIQIIAHLPINVLFVGFYPNCWWLIHSTATIWIGWTSSYTSDFSCKNSWNPGWSDCAQIVNADTELIRANPSYEVDRPLKKRLPTPRIIRIVSENPFLLVWPPPIRWWLMFDIRVSCR